MPQTTAPFSPYNFLISFVGEPPFGGFSEASHLSIHGINKATDITLKRGVVTSTALSRWLSSVRSGPPSRRDIVLLQRDSAGAPIHSWRLSKVLPMKYTGPTLSDKGNDVAIEELVLSVESIELVPPGC
jgi:phage tail-like protein